MTQRGGSNKRRTKRDRDTIERETHSIYAYLLITQGVFLYFLVDTKKIGFTFSVEHKLLFRFCCGIGFISFLINQPLKLQFQNFLFKSYIFLTFFNALCYFFSSDQNNIISKNMLLLFCELHMIQSSKQSLLNSRTVFFKTLISASVSLGHIDAFQDPALEKPPPLLPCYKAVIIIINFVSQFIRTNYDMLPVF